ncbi:MAG: hypothetical protein K2Y37_04360 [Pirellulales bacterium]|nr:hypothetical protein [Pirellulales bacterium]
MLINVVLGDWSVSLSDAGSVASLISLVISVCSFAATLFIASKIRSITKNFRQLALIPKWRSKLVACTKNLKKYRGSKDWLSFRQQCAAILPVTSELGVLTSGPEEKSITAVHSTAERIVQHAGTGFPEELPDALLTQLAELMSRLDTFLDKKHWK